MPEYKIEIGQTLSPDVWFAVRDHLAMAFSTIGKHLRQLNYEGRGEQDEAEFMAEATLAISALTYVGMFATDKCRIIVLPKPQK